MKEASPSVCQRCVELVPHAPPFRFVDEILSMSEETIVGTYKFRESSAFYKGHFPDSPITPGVLLTECMAQIALIAWGIYLTQSHLNPQKKAFALTSSDMHFLKPVLPGERVRVEGEKLYFRLGKLKVRAVMWNDQEEKVCRGDLAGVLLKSPST